MATKYNPANDKHQAWLAQNVLNIMKKWGFQIDADLSKDSWEFICSRADKFNPKKKIIVYTAVDRRTGGMRDCGMDRIRIVVLNEAKDGFAQRVARINRVGEFKSITDRLCQGIIKAQKVRV